MGRSAVFVQVTQEGQSAADILCQLEPNKVDPSEVKAENIVIRREKQTFHKLLSTGAVLFTVKTTITPLRDLNEDDLLNFAKEVAGWPDALAKYKGRNVWGDCVLQYCEKTLPNFHYGELRCSLRGING